MASVRIGPSSWIGTCVCGWWCIALSELLSLPPHRDEAYENCAVHRGDFSRAGDLQGVTRDRGSPADSNIQDQYTGEIFHRVQLVENLQVKPSLRLLVGPALNPEEYRIWLGSVRAVDRGIFGGAFGNHETDDERVLLTPGVGMCTTLVSVPTRTPEPGVSSRESLQLHKSWSDPIVGLS